MIMTVGAVLLLTAVCLAAVAVLLPSSPQVPLDRRRPFEAEPPSSLSRLALSAVKTLERLLGGRNLSRSPAPNWKMRGYASARLSSCSW